jgi:hypothetical protein
MKKKTNHWILEIILLLVFSFQISSLTAQNEVPDSLVTERLQSLKATLEHDRVHTQQWWFGWLGFYSAATVVQGAIYFSSEDKSLRQDMALGAATTILGAAGQFISSLMPNKKIVQFNMLPENSSDEQSKKLVKAEVLLQESIKQETQSRNWQNHAMTTAVNVGGGLITWLGFKRTFGAGFVNFAINEVVTETQIFTSPTFAKRNYKNYCRKYLNQDHAVSYTPETNWYLEARPGGLGIRVVF